ncbi:MAG: corrinoid protein [Pirellulales bacterium]|nr:corrinoid protein [Pirellulales bacterium]
MARNEELYQAVYQGNKDRALEAVKAAVDAGEDVATLLDESLIPAMQQIGQDFECGQAFVPEMLIVARAMSAALEYIQPLLTEAGVEPKGKVCAGTVKGDLHDIGKNLVAMMLKGAGYEVVDLGVDCSVDKFVGAIENGAKVVLISALLTTTMPAMKTVVDQIKPQYPDIGILVGGAPVTAEFAKSIGADGYGATANQAVPLVEKFFA